MMCIIAVVLVVVFRCCSFVVVGPPYNIIMIIDFTMKIFLY